MFCGDLLAGVVMGDPRGWRHSRLEVVPAYLLLRETGFREVLAGSAGAAPPVLEPIEWQEFARDRYPATSMLVVPSPASLLVAGHAVVPFRGRTDLLESLGRWAEPVGFGAWLVHGLGGQGKTRLAHELGQRLMARGWEVVWLAPRASQAQLRSVADASVPVLVVVDYAETRVEQLAKLMRHVARHPSGTPVKLLLLARTDQSWWEALLDSSSTTLLDGSPRTALEPLESTPEGRQDAYESAVTSLSTALPQVRDLEDQAWPAIATRLTRTPRRLRDITTVLGVHMTALADLLDAAHPADRDTVSASRVLDPEDRMLTHERRYRMNAATERGVRADIGDDETLFDAMTAGILFGAVDVSEADGVLARVPGLTSQPREVRAAVRRWMAALHSPLVGLSWGLPQRDRLAERFAGRRITQRPELVRVLLSSPVEKAQAVQLVTIYTRAAAHPVFDGRLDITLTELCVEHSNELAVAAVHVAPQVEEPEPLLAALMRISTARDTTDRLVSLLADEVPPSSHVLAPWAFRNATVLVDTRRAAVAYYDGGDADLRAAFAVSLNILAVRAGVLGRREEALAAAREAIEVQRQLATEDPDTYAEGLGVCSSDLAVRLTDTGRHAEAVDALHEAIGVFRRRPGPTSVETAGVTHNLATVLITLGQLDRARAHAADALAIYRALDDRPGSAMCLNTIAVAAVQHGHLADAVTAAEESVALYEALVDEHPDLHRVDHTKSLTTLSNLYAALQASDRAVTVAEKAVQTVRPLTETRPLAVRPVLAVALMGYALRLAETGQANEALTANTEAVDLLRALAHERPLAYGVELATALSNRSGRWAVLGNLQAALADSSEAIAHWRALADELT